MSSHNTRQAKIRLGHFHACSAHTGDGGTTTRAANPTLESGAITGIFESKDASGRTMSNGIVHTRDAARTCGAIRNEAAPGSFMAFARFCSNCLNLAEASG